MHTCTIYELDYLWYDKSLPLLTGGAASLSAGALFLDPLADEGRSSFISLPRPSSSTVSALSAPPMWFCSGGSPCSLSFDDDASLVGGGRLCEGCSGYIVLFPLRHQRINNLEPIFQVN